MCACALPFLLLHQHSRGTRDVHIHHKLSKAPTATSSPDSQAATIAPPSPPESAAFKWIQPRNMVAPTVPDSAAVPPKRSTSLCNARPNCPRCLEYSLNALASSVL